jgi:2,3-bisphosphoglycerate-dependent phosphoglycerate mutase
MLLRAPFYFLRHGETEVNRLGLVAGMQDVSLNETGERQAVAAARRLLSRGIDAVYSSPLKRARATADVVAQALALPVTEIPELAERNWGDMEGKPRALRRLDMTPAGGEGIEDFAQRTLAGLAKIAGATMPLVIAHSGTYRVLCRELGLEPPGPAAVVNCEPLRFTPAAGRWRVERLD